MMTSVLQLRLALGSQVFRKWMRGTIGLWFYSIALGVHCQIEVIRQPVPVRLKCMGLIQTQVDRVFHEFTVDLEAQIRFCKHLLHWETQQRF